MNARLSRLKSHFANWREWEMNPVVIKELRQSVRSWAVTGMLLLFLTVLFLTSLFFLVSQTFDNNPSQELGGTMFQTFAGILTFASVFFIPLYLGVRLSAERLDSNPDLLYISTLTPGRIIRGKFFCGAYMAVLFFSACLPFMAFTNLLRGVDLPSVFFILLFLFLVVCAINMLAIFLACLPMSRPFKVLIALYGLFQGVTLVYALVFASYRMMRSGIGEMLASANFWINFVTWSSIVLAGVELLYLLSVALISPASANRARPLRIYITAIWALSGLLSLAWVRQESQVSLILPWTYLGSVLLIISLLVTISNADQLSLRVRSKIPANHSRRALAFIFFNGAAGGMLWVFLLLLGTFLVTVVVALYGSGRYGVFRFQSGGLDEFMTCFPSVTAYLFAYALTAIFIHRRYLASRPPKIVGILAVILTGLWALVPSIAMFFLNRLSWKTIEGLQLGNLLNVFTTHEPLPRYYHLICATVWLFVMILLNAKWFLTQVKNFRPLQREAAPPVPAELPAISK